MIKRKADSPIWIVFQIIACFMMAVTIGFIVFIFVKSILTSQGIGLSNYYDILLGTPEYWVYFWNSFKISIAILSGATVVAVLGAYGLFRYNFHGKRILFGMLVLVMMMPYQVFMTAQLLVIYKLQLFDKLSGIIVPNMFASFGVVLLVQYMKQIPFEVIEAAQIDGANEREIFSKIVLPQIKEGIVAFAVLNLADTWNLVEQPQNMLKDCRLWPLSISFIQMEQSSFNILCAGSVVFLIPIFLVFGLGQEAMLHGITKLVGGIKNEKM